MIMHGGVRYWTADDLGASLVARGLAEDGGSRRVRTRRVQRWAWRNGLSPAATTKTGASLYREDECWIAINGESLARETVTH